MDPSLRMTPIVFAVLALVVVPRTVVACSKSDGCSSSGCPPLAPLCLPGPLGTPCFCQGLVGTEKPHDSSPLLYEGYSATRFNDLYDLTEASELLAPRKQQVIDTLGEVILRHGYEASAGIQLLHRHFELEQDEWLVDRMVMFPPDNKDAAEDNQLIGLATPLKIPADHSVMDPSLSVSAMVASVWKVVPAARDHDQSSSVVAWTPMEFTELLTAEEVQVAESIVKNDKFMKEYAEVVVKMGVMDIIGLAMIRASNASVYEYSSHEPGMDRLLKTFAKQRPPMSAVETSYEATWSASANGIRFCNRWCTALPTPPFHMTTHRSSSSSSSKTSP